MTLGLGLRLWVGGFIGVAGFMLSGYVDGPMVYTIGLLAGAACVVAGSLIPDF